MRWLFLFLLLTNVVYFGWELDRNTRMRMQNSLVAQPVPAAASRLTLIREMASPPAVRSTQDTIETSTGDKSGSGGDSPSPLSEALVGQLPDISTGGLSSGLTGSYCITYGPLPEQTQATGLNDWFRSRNADTRVRHTDQNERGLFWIYLAPLESRADAMALLDELRDQGIRDYRLIRRGNLENAISLGLFSSQSAVNQRLGELKNRGYKPVVVPYTDVNRIYWVDVKMGKAAEDMDEVINGYPARFNSVPVDCNQIAIGKSDP